MRKVSMTAEQGEVIAVIGPSGAGKSTLLRALCGLETITDGEIYIDDELLEKRSEGREVEKINSERRKEMLLRLGMVFQRFNLFPHKTARENIMLAPINVKKMSTKEAEAKANALLDRVGLSDKADEYPSRLSGGQQQRVAIARALAMEPEVMLFDEPTSALDPELVGEVLTVMSDLAKSGTSMIVVTHEMGFAREAANKVIFMCDGELAEEAPPSEFFSNPKNPRARQFLRSIL
ncbi:MAG: amino acid ABC transporter ATP-binding protein [Clostridiales Family XIII bacterium]|jgi:polar amino acid transport system ATP-binding protein|nr:amino acid ABC transporter ATP-binding protein [Clostridiales Family XIII bacterium]